MECGRDCILSLAKAWFELGDYEKYQEIIALITPPENDNSIEMMSELLLVNKLQKDNKDKIAKLLSFNEQGIKLFRSGLYPASTSVFLDAYEIMPHNTLLALNLAQSMTKGWPTTVEFSKKKKVAKQCINIIEAQPLDELSQKRYRSFESELKAL